MSELQLFRSREHPCGYLDNHVAQEVVVDPDVQLNPPTYAALLDGGFRRSGELVYRPECGSCRACQPARIPVAEFDLRRRHRRSLKHNAELDIELTDMAFGAVHKALYRQYLAARHPGSPMGRSTDNSTGSARGDAEANASDADDMLQFMGSDWCQTVLMNYYAGDRLVGYAITDLVPSGLSAMYTVFDPTERKRGLGTWSILQQIRLAQRYGLRWLYLGYWIAQCRSMAYKTNFAPLEVRSGEQWQRLKPT